MTAAKPKPPARIVRAGDSATGTDVLTPEQRQAVDGARAAQAAIDDLGAGRPRPGRLLVSMHYPLPLEVRSGILRAVGRAFPGATLGDDGTIRERDQ